MSKGFSAVFILIGVLALLSVAGGAYYLGQRNDSQPFRTITSKQEATPPLVADEAVNWKIYTNNKYHFNFKYPQNWSYSGFEESVCLYNTPTNDAGPGYVVCISHMLPDSGVKIEDQVGTKKEIADKVFEEKVADLNIDNKPAAKFIMTVLPGSQTEARPGILVKVKNGSDLFDINFYFQDHVSEKTFNEILSTFKFLDQTTTKEEGFINFNGRKLTIKTVGEGEYCEGRVSSSQITYPKCSVGLKCQFTSGSAQDAPGICVKE